MSNVKFLWLIVEGLRPEEITNGVKIPQARNFSTNEMKLIRTVLNYALRRLDFFVVR